MATKHASNIEHAIRDLVLELVREHLENFDFSDELESAVEDYDFTYVIAEQFGKCDWQYEIASALSDYDFADEIASALSDYDFADEINAAVDHEFSRIGKLEADIARLQDNLQVWQDIVTGIEERRISYRLRVAWVAIKRRCANVVKRIASIMRRGR